MKQNLKYLHAIVTFGNLAALATRTPSGDVDVFVCRPTRYILELQTSVFASDIDHETLKSGLVSRDEPAENIEELLYFSDQMDMPSTPVVQQRRGQNFDAGCWVLIAPYARGKTVLAQGFAETGEYYRFGEPEGGAIYYSQLLSKTAEFLVSDRKMWFVDSIRNLTYMSGGSTGEGGVNNEIFVFIGALSAAARRCDKVLVLTWNPLLPEDSDRFTKVINATISSATGVMTPSEVRKENDHYLVISGRRYGREADGERTDRAFTVRVPVGRDEDDIIAPTQTIRNWSIEVAQPTSSIPSTLLSNLED